MKVLLTTDGSKAAEQTISWFAHLPIKHSSTYPAITVSNYHIYGVTPAAIFDETVRLECENASESFKRAATILKETAIESVHIARMGHAADEITQHAADMKADLIVVGAHGKSMVERLFLGSTSETVAQHAPCSVLIARPSATDSSRDSKTLVVTIACDGSDSDALQAACVNALNVSKNAKIHLISVVEHPYMLDPEYEYGSQIMREAHHALDRMAETLAISTDNIEKHVVLKPQVADAIIDFVQTNSTDILVFGDKGRSGISRFLLGSVSRRLLRTAPCSTLIVKKPKMV